MIIEDKKPFFIAIFLGFASVISLINNDLYPLSILFAVVNLAYYIKIKKSNLLDGKLIRLIVFSVIIISIIFSSLLFLFEDTDKDGFLDRNDPCKNEYGLNKGCKNK